MLSSGIMQRAFVEAIVLGARLRAARRLDPAAAARVRGRVAHHAMLPGLVIAALAGVPLLLGAAGGRARRRGRDRARGARRAGGGDVGVAVVVSGLFGLGGILALSPETPPRLGELLFGDLLGITDGDLLAAAAARAGVLVALALALPRAGRDRLRPRQRAGARHPARPRRPRAARAARRHDRRRRPGPRQPAARRARPRARRRGAEPRRSGCRTILALAAGLAAVAGDRRAGHLLRARDRGGRERRSVRRRTLRSGPLETKVRHAII